jgi:dCTP deaminase
VILSNVTIRELVATGVLIIDPFRPEYVQPCSYDLTIAENLSLGSFESKLAYTAERLYLPPHIRGKLSGRSSVARLFVQPECSGGFIDPGFPAPPLSPDWQPRSLTLELTNLSRVPQRFQAGDRLVQIEFAFLDRPAEPPYYGRYHDQEGPTASRFEHGSR